MLDLLPSSALCQKDITEKYPQRNIKCHLNIIEVGFLSPETLQESKHYTQKKKKYIT